MNERGPFVEFGRDLMREHLPALRRLQEQHSEEWSETDLNLWLDLDGPVTIPFEFSAREEFVSQMTNRWREIAESLETLEDIAVYTRSFPYRTKSLSRTRTLRYHRENWLNETYVFRNRLSAFLSVLRRSYRSDRRYPQIKRTLEELENLISDGFASLVDNRGHHIHNARIRDLSHKRLVSLELYRDLTDERLFEGLYQVQYMNARDAAVEEIRTCNETFSEILDAIFTTVRPIVFSETSELILPANVSAA